MDKTDRHYIQQVIKIHIFSNEDIEHSLTPYEKIDSEWIQDLNVNLESKLFEKQLHP